MLGLAPCVIILRKSAVRTSAIVNALTKLRLFVTQVPQICQFLHYVTGLSPLLGVPENDGQEPGTFCTR